MKSTLVSAVSHELKTPLASLTATITGLLEGDLPWEEARVRQELAAIEQDLVRLSGSIGSLLDLSRLEASEWQPHLEQYEFGEVLGTALSKFTPSRRAASWPISPRTCLRSAPTSTNGCGSWSISSATPSPTAARKARCE